MLIHFVFGDHAFFDQTLCIDRSHARMCLHARVHQRLRVARFVGFVMTKPAKSNHIEHDVFIELLPVIERDLHRAISRFRIVAVDVKDRQLRHARDVGRVDRGASCFRRSRKSDLVVDDDVNRAAGAIAFEIRPGSSVSITMPCPANAASPCSRTGSARSITCFASDSHLIPHVSPASRGPFPRRPDQRLPDDSDLAKASV